MNQVVIYQKPSAQKDNVQTKPNCLTVMLSLNSNNLQYLEVYLNDL